MRVRFGDKGSALWNRTEMNGCVAARTTADDINGKKDDKRRGIEET